MRVLVLTTDAFGSHGGIAKYNRDLLTALCACPDCEEVVAVPRLMPYPVEELPKNLTYVTKGLGSKINYIWAVLNVVLRNYKFDLIVCGHINLVPIAYLLRLLSRAPIVLVIYGIDVWHPTKSVVVNRLSQNIDAYISISEVTKNKFISWAKLTNGRIYLLPNAINIEEYGPGDKNIELMDRYGLHGKIVILTLGRLASEERYKGIDEILDILPTLVKELPDLVYLIVGDGSDRARLGKKAITLGIAEHVIFTGRVPEFEKAAHYRLADVYVMPSQGEGFGFVFLEAMACGVPVVASTIDGSREAVRDGKLGIVVDPRNPHDILRGIKEALAQPKGIVPEGLEFFSYRNFEQRCHSIVDQVVQSPTKRRICS